ncbi:MAG: DUF4129 domain-containing protein [Candidatus Hodarchaeales archaeon]
MVDKRLESLRRKETFLIIFLLLSLAIFQITMELLHGRREENPVLQLNLPIFELIAIAIPLLILIWILLKLEFPFRIFKPISIWIVGMLLIFMMASLITGNDYTPEDFNPFETTTTMPLSSTIITETDITLTDSSETTTTTRLTREPLLALPMLDDIQNSFFIVLILVSAIIILRTGRKKQIEHSEPFVPPEEDQKIIKEFEGAPKNIIECYYQTSDHLEGQGADKSDHLTAKEFELDVEEKKLTTNDDFSELTNLFTEAKFSEHIISENLVHRAKVFSKKIIFESSKVDVDPLEEEE